MSGEFGVQSSSNAVTIDHAIEQTISRQSKKKDGGIIGLAKTPELSINGLSMLVNEQIAERNVIGSSNDKAS